MFWQPFFRSDKLKSLCTCVEGFELIRLVKGHQLNTQRRDLLHIQLRNNLDIRKNVETYFCQVLPYAVFYADFESSVRFA